MLPRSPLQLKKFQQITFNKGLTLPSGSTTPNPPFFNNVKINLQSLEDTQVGYKNTLWKNILWLKKAWWRWRPSCWWWLATSLVMVEISAEKLVEKSVTYGPTYLHLKWVGARDTCVSKSCTIGGWWLPLKWPTLKIRIWCDEYFHVARSKLEKTHCDTILIFNFGY